MQYDRNGIGTEEIIEINSTNNKKRLRFILSTIVATFFLLITIKFGLADLTTDNEVYFGFDNSSHNFTTSGYPETVTQNFNGSIFYDSTASGEYTTFGDIEFTEAGENFSVSLWVNTSTFQNWGGIIGKLDVHSPDDGWIIASMSDGTTWFKLYDTAGDGNDAVSAQLTDVMSTGELYHLVLTYDGQYNNFDDADDADGITWYINGVEANISQIEENTFLGMTAGGNSEELWVGAESPGTVVYYDGYIGNIKIYDYILSADNVTTLYSDNDNFGDEIFYYDTNNFWDMTGNDNNIESHVLGHIDSVVTDGLISNAINCDGTDDYLDIDYVSLVEDELAISVWYKGTDTSDAELISSFDSASPFDGWGIRLNAGGVDNKIQFWDGGAFNDVTTTTDYNDGDWHHLLITFNSTTGEFWYDGINTDNFTLSTGLGELGQSTQTSTFVCADSNSPHGRYLGGMIDEVGIWERKLSQSEIQELYNSGEGYNPYSPTAPIATNTSATFIYPSPPNDAHNDTQQTFNISCSSGTVNLWFNGTQVLENQPNPSNYTTNVTTVGQYILIANCNDSGVISTNTTRTWYYDNIDPVWTINTFATDNSSIISVGHPGNITFNDTLSDHYVFAYNITMYYPNGSIWWSNQTTGIAGDSVTFSDVKYTNDNMPGGIYTINYYGEDDHTAKKIPDYAYWASLDGLEYWTPSGSYIQIKNLFSTHEIPTTTKKNDRYNFNFNTNGTKGKWNFELISNEKLWYRENLYPFPSFVTGKHWVDFKIKNIPPEHITYTVQQKTDYLYEIEIEIEENYGNIIEFESLGGLNFVNLTFQVLMLNMSIPSYQGQTPTNNTFANEANTINLTGCGANNYVIWMDNTTTPTTLQHNSTTNTWDIPETEGLYYYRTQCYNTTANTYSNFSTTRTYEYNLTNVTLNIFDDDGNWIASTSTLDNHTSSTINTNPYLKELGDFITLRTDNITVNFNISDNSGRHTNEIENLEISQTNHVYNITMSDRVRMILTFTENTNVTIVQINNVTTSWLNVTTITLNTSRMASGDTYVIWNQKDGYEQKWYFNNNYSNTYINKTMYVIPDYTYYYTISKVTVKNNLNTQIDGAEVEWEVAYNDTWITIGGDKTLADGSGILTYQPGSSYKVTVSNQGYETLETIQSYGADTNRKVLVITALDTGLGNYYCYFGQKDLQTDPDSRTMTCVFTANNIFASIDVTYNTGATGHYNLTTSDGDKTLSATITPTQANSPINVTVSIASAPITYWNYYYRITRPNITERNNGTISVPEDAIDDNTTTILIAVVLLSIIMVFVIALGETKMPGLGLAMAGLFTLLIGIKYFATLWHFALIGSSILIFLAYRRFRGMM